MRCVALHRGLRLPSNRADGKHGGRAFIDFATPEGADAALAKNGETMMTRYLNIQRSRDQNKGGKFGDKGGAGDRSAPRKQELSAKPDGCKTVFVGNLSWQATQEDLQEAFKGCGTISNVRIAWDKDNDRSKGSALLHLCSVLCWLLTVAVLCLQFRPR